jgi:hypothetical protein
MYDINTKIRAIKYYYQYKSYCKAANLINCSVGIVYKWVNEEIKIKTRSNKRCCKQQLNNSVLDKIRTYIEDNQGICVQTDIQRHMGLSKYSVKRAIDMIRFSRKRSSVQMGGTHVATCLPLRCLMTLCVIKTSGGSADYPNCLLAFGQQGNWIGKRWLCEPAQRPKVASCRKTKRRTSKATL